MGRGNIHKGATANTKNRRKKYIHIYKENLIKQGKTKEHLNYSGFRHSERRTVRTAKEIRKESGRYFPGLSCSPGGPIWTGVWCLVWTSCNVRPDPVYLIHPCTVCFHFCLVFFFFFTFVPVHHTLIHSSHTQLLVLNEPPEPRSVEFFFLLLLGTFYYYYYYFLKK